MIKYKIEIDWKMVMKELEHVEDGNVLYFV